MQVEKSALRPRLLRRRSEKISFLVQSHDSSLHHPRTQSITDVMVSSSSSSALLTLRYASLEDVAQDLDMVIQSTSQDEWSWDGASESERQAWQQFVENPALTTRSAVAGLAGNVQVAKEISLSFSLLSHTQQGSGEHKAMVDVSAPTLASDSLTRVKQALVERSKEWQQEGIESLFLFDLLTTAQTLAADLPDQPCADTLEPASSDPAPSDPSVSPTRIELSRALFWSHHLKAPSKLKDFNNWCPELGIWGVLRIGHPGYMCFEGEASAVDEMVRRVKGLQWHAMQLRVQTAYTWSSGGATTKKGGARSSMERALLSCALAKGHPDNAFEMEGGGDGKVRTGCQVIESLGELVTRLKECRLAEDEIETVLGIHISGGGQ